jgi:L-arabinokinase
VRVKYFEPSQDPAEGLGVLLLFRLIEESVPAFFAPDRRILITRAPGRLDVLGGRAPGPRSLVLQMPIAEAACLAVQPRDDDLVRLWSPCRDGSRTQMLSMALRDLGLPGQAIDYDEARALLLAEPRDRWAGHLLGAILVLARERGLVLQRGAEVLLHSDIPDGCGVAASSAITVAALRAFALLAGGDLPAPELAGLCTVVEGLVMRTPLLLADAQTVASARAGELLALRGDTVEQSLVVPSDLEVVALDTGVVPTAPRHGGEAVADAARAERFRELWQAEPSLLHRAELGELLFAAHADYATAGRGHPVVDLVVDEARKRCVAGGALHGAKATGRGGGGTVVLLGPHGKIWYEALRIKKVLHAATGHSAHVFRWSSPGACAFGSIELRPKGSLAS